jgi:hypothetical protein
MPKKSKTVQILRTESELRIDIRFRGPLKEKMLDLMEHTEEEPSILLKEITRSFFRNNPNPHRF